MRALRWLLLMSWLMLAGLAWPVAAGATELFVSPSGDDAASGGRSTPLRTVGRAASLARPGATIHIMPGTYLEQLITHAAGTPDKPIVFAAFESGVVLDGALLPPEPHAGREQNRGVVELRHAWNVVRGLTIRNSPYSGIVLGASHLVVTGNTVTGTRRHAISTDTRFQPTQPAGLLTDITISGNRVTRAVQRGLGYGQAISLIADGFSIRENEVLESHTEGIDVWLGARNGSVVGNHVHHNVRTGIYLDGVIDVVVRANRVHDNGHWLDGSVPGAGNGHGIGVASEDTNYPTRGVIVVNNLVYRNQRTGIFVWDSPTAAGYRGSQDVLIAYNTVLENGHGAIRLVDGIGNTGEVAFNIYDGRSPVSGDMDVYSNFRASPEDFVGKARGDFRLRDGHRGRNRGGAFRHPAFKAVKVMTDYQGAPRGERPDAGAFEANRSRQ